MLRLGLRAVRRNAALASVATRSVAVRAPTAFAHVHARGYSTEGSVPPAGEPRKLAFQAETRKLLDIVAKSLYSEKEVFVRELISNASDALEKLRYLRSTNSEFGSGADAALEIQLTTDEDKGTLTLRDSGIGMTEEELISNLGTIARSGSKAFMEEIEKGGSGSVRDNIIGQFGVGFYSAFMVGQRVEVTTRSARDTTSNGLLWSSDGSGEYEISVAKDVPIGTQIVIHLHDSCKQFAQSATVEAIVKKYSNFVGHPVLVNGKRANNVLPLWLMPRDAVKEADVKEFYRFVSGAFDDPQYYLHYSADAPLMLRALLFVPQTNFELMNMHKQEHGVSLYTRKVLIQAKCRQILPDWLRFVKGVVDSEDIPLNLSREMLQDSALIARIRSHLTGRVLRWIGDEAKRDPERYQAFFRNFGVFLKEGICTDAEFQERIAKLLRFQSSQTPSTQVTSLEAYVSRMKPGQKGIYFLNAPSHELALESPYYDPFRESDTEVLFLTESIDEFVANALGKFDGKQMINIQAEDVDVKDVIASKKKNEEKGEGKEEEDKKKKEGGLSEEKAKELAQWFVATLGTAVSDVRVSTRLVAHPAIVVGHESAAARRMMAMLNPSTSLPQMPQILEINAGHELMIKLEDRRRANPLLAELVGRQIFDNAQIAAGIVEDARPMLPRLQKLLDAALSAAKENK